MSKVVLTLEFPNVAAAAEALNRMLGSAQTVMSIPTISLPVGVPAAGQIVAQDAQSLPSAPPPPTTIEKPARKPRSDAGQPRGPHKSGEPAASEPGTGAVNSVAASTPAAPATPSQSTAPAPQPTAAAPQAGVVAPAAADPNKKLTKEDATDALGRMNKTSGLGMPACIEHLKLFGVNRISVLPEKDFALFIKQADEKIAEHLAAAKK